MEEWEGREQGEAAPSRQYVRCLFCSTGNEEAVVAAIHRKGWGQAIFPQRAYNRWRHGEWLEQLVPLLPGYVFVYSQEEKAPYRQWLELRHVIRVLRYPEGEEWLRGWDLEFAQWLWKLNGKVGVMKALQVGDEIQIVDGVFKSLNGVVARMDRRRKTIQVRLNTQGFIRQIWLTYQVVEKLEAGAGA